MRPESSRALRRTSMLLVLIATATLPGCARTAPDPCSLFRWIEVPEADEATLSPELMEQIRAHDQAWLETCEP